MDEEAGGAGLEHQKKEMAVLAILRDAGAHSLISRRCGGYNMADMKNEDYAQKRFCDEITFQRDSSKSLICSSLLFKIMTTDKTTKKRRLFSAA